MCYIVHVYIATRNDVARASGVSSATVSRTYNHPETVLPEVRTRVLKTAEKLGYVPHSGASALRSGRTGIIALVEHREVSQLADRFLAWLYADMIKGIMPVLSAANFTLIHFPVRTAAEIPLLRTRRICDGVIAHDLMNPAMLNALHELGLPYVCAFREPDPKLHQVRLDEAFGGKLAGERFLAAGKNRPAHITGMLKNSSTCQARWQGFRKAYGRKPVRLIDGNLGIQGGYESGRKLTPDIRRGLVDSVFVVNDITAVGVVQAFREKGLEIPKDVSIIAHDNLPILDTLPVRLSSVDISFNAIYSLAAEKLVESIKSGVPVHETVKPVLIEGASV
jgi:LacI family transcriptional regulator